MKTNKLLCIFTSAALVIGGMCGFNNIPTDAASEMRDITTMELVREMGVGINLGNTFEASGSWVDQWGDGSPESYYTCWGSPIITQEMIQGYADEGFGVLRVPVHWFNLMDDDYNLSQEYIASVKQVVDWALAADLYVIVNLHHDDGVLFANFPTDKETSMYGYRKIWTQVAEAFRDYDDHLMLESLNEEGCWDSVWNRWGDGTGKAEAIGLLNEINQAFVDVVRASGGNNAQRHLLIAGYATGIEETCDPLFQMPDDPIDRCAVSVHYYTPSTFAILTEDADWGKARSTWGTEEDYAELYYYMDKMKETYIDNGIAVIIGEYGCPRENKEDESVYRFLSSVCQSAYDRQMCALLWDVTGYHYDRETCKMVDPKLRDLLTSIPKNGALDTAVKGDVNADGEFNISDVVLMQKWLLALPDTALADWKAADLCNDDKLNVFDLCLMKRELLS